MKTIVINNIPTPEVAPMLPEVLPDTRPIRQPHPNEDDPFYFPAPLIDPTPKG